MKAFKVILICSITLLILIYIREYDIISFGNTRIKTKLVNHESVQNITTRYILMWTHNYTVPFELFARGNETFVKARCPYQNCYITNDRSHKAITEWDALLFHAPEYAWDSKPSVWNHGYPSERSPHQEYIFSTIESSANYPVTNPKWNSYFNWTMTYRLDSEIPWIYFIIMDMSGNIIGPAEGIEWLSNMQDVSAELKEKFKLKNKTAAWIVSNCHTASKREDYAASLKKELEALNRTLDIYGKCGDIKCTNELIEGGGSCTPNMEDYYFYLAFENSFSKYYTTEKLLRPMQSNVVPIVFGGSNYDNFAPPTSYINARNHSPKELAKIMDEHIRNPEEYAKYFAWTNHYRYIGPYENPYANPFCVLCEALNKPDMRKFSSYDNFISWWNQ